MGVVVGIMLTVGILLGMCEGSIVGLEEGDVEGSLLVDGI